MPTDTLPDYNIIASDYLKDLIHLEETEDNLIVKFIHVTGRGMCMLTAHKDSTNSNIYSMIDTGNLVCETINEIGVTLEARILADNGTWEVVPVQ